MLPRLTRPRGPLQGRQRVVHRSQHGLSSAQRVHRPGLDQTLENALVQEAGLDPFAKIIQAAEFPLAQPRLADGLRRVLSNVLDCSQPEPYRFSHWRKIQVTL